MVKAGNWFFLINLTFYMFPGLLIYAPAKADTRLTPLYDSDTPTEVMACTGGLYTPTIRHHNSIFYVEPYEAYSHNPILTAKGTDKYIRYTGHYDVIEDDKGQWWGVCLSVRKDASRRFIKGRETFLTRGT
ncbi:hypothetical protein SBRCBS47491_001788 [Sporothrix bragantina]|uniref:Secreted protein n=1 Tax=Sporothrix bragantina TaxID=671064 RepID=A0ABP0B1H7_9PEZI